MISEFFIIILFYKYIYYTLNKSIFNNKYKYILQKLHALFNPINIYFTKKIKLLNIII
jgi:hypothetical protein